MKSRTEPIIIAIDGPAGAGKSTISKLLAKKFNFTLIDTGALYRCVALLCKRENFLFDSSDIDEKKLRDVIASHSFHFQFTDINHVFIDSEDVTHLIRNPDISLFASKVSAHTIVREELLVLQRSMGYHDPNGVVLEGRDIGTVVFPDADIKFFLTATPEIRAQRRLEEYHGLENCPSYQECLNDIITRDKNDRERLIAPLKKAEDAIEVDTSNLNLQEILASLETHIREKVFDNKG